MFARGGGGVKKGITYGRTDEFVVLQHRRGKPVHVQ